MECVCVVCMKKGWWDTNRSAYFNEDVNFTVSLLSNPKLLQSLYRLRYWWFSNMCHRYFFVLSIDSCAFYVHTMEYRFIPHCHGMCGLSLRLLSVENRWETIGPFPFFSSLYIVQTTKPPKQRRSTLGVEWIDDYVRECVVVVCVCVT